MMDTGIAQRLRDAGLSVVECAGWQTRGSSSFDPRGSVDHHTAGPATGDAPSLNTCINGRPDLAGPLCNVLIGRNPTNTCYVISAGRANHAGSGGWHGLSGNSSVYGIERENVGTAAEPWRPDQTDAAARAHAALIRGRAEADMVCRHQEWTSRKIDTHDVNGSDLRNLVNKYLHGGGGEPPPNLLERYGMFCIVQPEIPGAGVYRFNGSGMIGIPNPTILAGDQIQLGRLGLDTTVWSVSKEWFDSWPMIRA